MQVPSKHHKSKEKRSHVLNRARGVVVMGLMFDALLLQS